MTMNDTAVRKMLTLEEVLTVVPVSETTLYRMQMDGRFPRSHAGLGQRRFWFEDEIRAWQDSLNGKF
jgi:predicted DNA-binding transcriptional regulator AlpA